MVLAMWQITIVIDNTKIYQQSSWVRGVHYWPYYSVFDICTLFLLNSNKKINIRLRSGKIEMSSLKAT